MNAARYVNCSRNRTQDSLDGAHLELNRFYLCIRTEDIFLIGKTTKFAIYTRGKIFQKISLQNEES